MYKKIKVETVRNAGCVLYLYSFLVIQVGVNDS